jgi:integrase
MTAQPQNENALILDQVSPVERAALGWLHEKSTRTGSAETKAAYTDVFQQFRWRLQSAGLDLDGDKQAVKEAAQVWAGESKIPGRQVSPATYNQRLAILSSFYRYAVKNGYLETNPVDLVERRPNKAYKSATPLDSKAVQRALKAIDRTTLEGKRDYALLLIGGTTGRRASELANLRWRDLQIVGSQILVTWSRCKGGKVMHDRLTEKVSRALLDYLLSVHGAELGRLPADTPVWVRTSHNARQFDSEQPISTQTISDICLKHLGTSKVHTLRHTFAHLMEQTGAKTSDIQSRLGHESLDTTSRYLKALASADNPQAELIADMIGAD